MGNCRTATVSILYRCRSEVSVILHDMHFCSAPTDNDSFGIIQKHSSKCLICKFDNHQLIYGLFNLSEIDT